jgi:SsrA-binding protein
VAAKKTDDAPRALATNRAASHEYYLSDRTEAGIVLAGTEVKTARAGKVNLKEAFARIENGEAWLHGAHFSPYSHGNRENHEPVRPRKLLLHASEIRKLARETQSSGVTLVPTKIYARNGRIKVEIAVGRGKKLHDKRETSRKRDMDREMERALGRRERD